LHGCMRMNRRRVAGAFRPSMRTRPTAIIGRSRTRPFAVVYCLQELATIMAPIRFILELVLCTLSLISCGRPVARRNDVLAAASQPAVEPAPSSSVAPIRSPPALPGAPDVAALVARVRPAVVNITVTSESATPGATSQSPFDFFFGRQRGSPARIEGDPQGAARP
jgi:hypothetical protein